jgi:hypothetical protein
MQYNTLSLCPKERGKIMWSADESGIAIARQSHRVALVRVADCARPH